MKKILSFAFTIALLLTVKAIVAQDSADMMKAWLDYMTPGEQHKRLARETGTWEAVVNSWEDPSQPPQKMKASNVVTMTMNGLFQMGKFSGTIAGLSISGQSILGYDNAKKMYVFTWIDNMGSGITNMTGQYNEATKTMTLKGTQTAPATGANMEIREEIKYHDNDSYTLTMFGPGVDGKEMKMMEGVFKRKK